jgi:hypothetical protein
LCILINNLIYNREKNLIYSEINQISILFRNLFSKIDFQFNIKNKILIYINIFKITDINYSVNNIRLKMI